MYFPKQDEAFGSFYFYKRMPVGRNRAYIAKYRLERTYWKTLRTESHICNEQNSEANTTKCITRYLEQKVGCSIGMQGTDPDMKRCDFMLLTFQIVLFRLFFRCTHTGQLKQYALTAQKIQFAVDDTQIFQLTGCLASCDKYHYSAYPRADLEWLNGYKDSLQISFMLPNGHNEVKEQVMKKSIN